ncbi:MAG: oligosaccharide flippase family protein [Flavobacteriales bacterium]
MTSERKVPGWLKRPSVSSGSFASNIGFTAGKSLIGIIAQLVFTPIIVSLYSPEAYGSFGFIMSLTSIILPLSTLQYDKAIYMAKDRIEIEELSKILHLTPVFMSVFLTISYFLIADFIPDGSSIRSLGYGILLTPLLIILTSWAQTSQHLMAVNYRYKDGFLFGSASMIGSKLVSIAYAVLFGGWFGGLALSEVFNRLGQLVVNNSIILKRPIFPSLAGVRSSALRATALKYISFPKFDLPAVLLAALSKQVPLFWIPRSFGLASFGHYVLAVSLLEVPMRLLGYSLSSVFFQRAVKAYASGGIGQLRQITLKTIVLLSGAGFIPLVLIGLFAQELFVLFFGETWSVSGAIAQRLCIAYSVRMVVEPIGAVLRVLGEQKKFLVFNTAFLFMRIGAMAVGMLTGVDLITAVTFYALAEAAGYLLLGGSIVLRLFAREKP